MTTDRAFVVGDRVKWLDGLYENRGTIQRITNLASLIVYDDRRSPHTFRRRKYGRPYLCAHLNAYELAVEAWIAAKPIGTVVSIATAQRLIQVSCPPPATPAIVARMRADLDHIERWLEAEPKETP